MASTALSSISSPSTTSIFTFGQEIDHVFGAAVELSVALLAAETLCLDDGDALETDLLKRFFHLVELEGLDNGFDFFHAPF